MAVVIDERVSRHLAASPACSGVQVQLGVLAQATGSARVRLGETDVIVGVKVR